MLLALTLQATPASWANDSQRNEKVVESACDSPPCSKDELRRYEKRLIKRVQRANMLSAEARFRGETHEAERLHRVFRRNFDRRLVVAKAIQNPDE